MIKNWKEYNESVGGFEIPLKQIGPNYGEQELQNTITKSDTTPIKGSNGRMYFQSDFLDLYNRMIQFNKTAVSFRDFNKQNLEELLLLDKE
jgi:hypothetical protein